MGGAVRGLAAIAGDLVLGQPILTYTTRSGCLVEPLAQLLAALEERNVLLGHLDAGAGARIASDSCLAPPHREGAEASQFHPVVMR